jgi:1-aminocyclopropane-1-carboxylate deaminase/D-cysteine desulfhydrase-like pyridoxal-dependent ACC family enzyme
MWEIHTKASCLEFVLERKGVELWVKRDDLIHPEISGNKWRKLKGHLEDFERSGKTEILTFGGAFSNHIAATAALGHLCEIPTHALIRGEEEMKNNPTLEFCLKKGMRIEGISRKQYDTKDDLKFLRTLALLMPQVFIIPEGGKGPLGLQGCLEIAGEVAEGFDYWAVAGGTGTTAAGLLASPQVSKLLLYPALKGGKFLVPAIFNQLLAYYENHQGDKVSMRLLQQKILLRDQYHFGGYAKVNADLVDFLNTFYQQYGLKLDPVYTGKMFFGLLQDIDQGVFPKGSKILAIHSGGLQGIAGANQTLRKKNLETISYEY